MGFLGMAVGGGAGAVAGGAGGAMIGAGLGNYVEDNVLGGGPPKPGAAPKATPIKYDHTGTSYASERTAADQREAAYKMDWSNADKQMTNAAQARARQDDLAQRLRDRADGKLGSLAEQQLMRGQEAAMRAQLNAAANTRGGGGAALAARADAADRGLIASQATNAEAAMLRFREQAAAEQQLAELYGQMRGADLSGAGLVQNREQMMADNLARARQQNDARSLGLLQAQIEEQKAKAGVAGQSAAIDYQGQMAAYAAQNAAANAKYQANQQMAGSLINAGADYASKKYSADKEAETELAKEKNKPKP